ncbi:MAG TPA: DUF5916 domain-containing protein [Vicinamibacterales bacterium]|nr:DUF5916 domain-containing protein [Vicinamibacterales bacterium]
MKLFHLALITALVPTATFADERRVVLTVDAIAVPSNSPVVLDGRFNEEVWQQAPAISDFQQREPAEGQAPTHRTEARMAYDATSLYVAVRAFDADPDKIVGILTRRDQRSPSDWIKIVVDSYFDKRSAYEFGVNPVGVKLDRYYFNDGQSDDSWDAVWDVQVERDADGWRAEFKIPFSQLRFNTLSGGPVGFAVIREVGRLAEIVTWPLLSRNASGFVSQFGEMRGLRMDGAPKKFELMPYTVADLRTQPGQAGNPLSDPSDPGAAVGLDMKYALTPGLTLTATVNPDFGQVEADPAVVNLDAFETFFQERRPFFVEGSGTFRFNMDCNDGNCTGMFYSRRIGRAPQGSPPLNDGEYSKQPDAATIIGAGKLTGRVGGFSIGALTAVTAREDAEIAAGSEAGLGRRSLGEGGRRDYIVEPITGYTVVRARKEFANQSSVGFMTTSTNRQNSTATSFLADNAFAGGVDYDWRITPMYNVSGYWATTHIAGSPEAITRLQENNVHGFQRPDADYVDVDYASTTLRGHAGSVSLGKIAGETIRFSTFLGYKSPGFDTNDLGFMRRADERQQSNWIQWRNFRPGKYVRTRNLNLNQYQGWNFGGDRTYSGANINSHWTFTNYYNIGGGYNFDAAPFRDRVTRGGPGVLGNPTKSAFWYYANTDNRKPLQFYYNGGHWMDTKNSSRHDIMPGFNWRATSSISLNIGLRYFINHDDSQWVTNETLADGSTRYVFGRIDQKTMSFNTRFNYTVTPTLSLQVYAEPFVSAGNYSNYKELIDGRAEKYEERYRSYAYPGNADFNIRSFRTTNVVRWEYRPGSTLFAVWQQGKSDYREYGDFRFGRDFSGVFSAPSRNTFLVKFSYWLNM